MKRLFFFAAFTVLGLFFISCKKDVPGQPPVAADSLPAAVRNFVPQAVIDSMEAYGFVIHDGLTPPNIQGIYNVSPHYCTFDNSGYNMAGRLFSDYRYRFYDYNAADFSIRFNYKTVPSLSDTASGVGAFVSGTGDKFTLFVNMSGVSNGVWYKAIGFYSGTITNAGIKDFQSGYYAVDKGPDPGNVLVSNGTSRIFIDKDSLAAVAASYRPMGGTGSNTAQPAKTVMER